MTATGTALDPALASRWSDAGDAARASSADAAALAAMPLPFIGDEPPDFVTRFTTAKTQLLNWALTVAPDLAGIPGRIAEAGGLAPMLAGDALERQLAGLGEESLPSLLWIVSSMVLSQRVGCMAAAERVSRWRREVDETRRQLLAMRDDRYDGTAVCRATELLGQSIARYTQKSPEAQPRIVLAFLDPFHAAAFGIIADDAAAAAVAADRAVVAAHRVACDEFASADPSTRGYVFIDLAVLSIDVILARAQQLEQLAADTAAAWQPVENGVQALMAQLSGDDSAARSVVVRMRDELQCVHDVQEAFRSAGWSPPAEIPAIVRLTCTAGPRAVLR